MNFRNEEGLRGPDISSLPCKTAAFGAFDIDLYQLARLLPSNSIESDDSTSDCKFFCGGTHLYKNATIHAGLRTAR